VFDVRGPTPASVLVVDDVCTTGATLAAAAEALRTAGTSTVHALVLARTPAGQGRR
jgi:predicted amidophosphoribosyltransferase